MCRVESFTVISEFESERISEDVFEQAKKRLGAKMDCHLWLTTDNHAILKRSFGILRMIKVNDKDLCDIPLERMVTSYCQDETEKTFYNIFTDNFQILETRTYVEVI